MFLSNIYKRFSYKFDRHISLIYKIGFPHQVLASPLYFKIFLDFKLCNCNN